jgi:hypothetical protein
MAGRVVGKVTFKSGDSGGNGGGFQAGMKSWSGGGVAPLQPARRETIMTRKINQQNFFISFLSFLKRAQGARFRAQGKNVNRHFPDDIIFNHSPWP